MIRRHTLKRLSLVILSGAAAALAAAAPTGAAEGTRPPNIVVIWGDDIGQFNVSAYNQGMMG